MSILAGGTSSLDDAGDVRKDDKGVWHFKAGATIRTTISFSCSGSRYHVALMDPLAAGTESVNPELGGARTQGRQGYGAMDSDGNFISEPVLLPWWTWTWFEHQNLRDHQAEAFSSLLNPGSYTYTYIVRATTPGTYFVPPCKAEEMYQPETFGRTATEQVVVE